MGRFSKGRSYGHRIHRVREDEFALKWTVDYYYPGSRLRHPRRFVRFTDHTGALRFAKRWGLSAPTTVFPAA